MRTARDGDDALIFLTDKDSEADQVRGIGLGADDYISKDCSDAVMLDRAEIARLTKTEVDLLEIFNSRRGGYFTSDQLIEMLRGQGFACADSMLYTHISNLRRKLGRAGEMLTCERGAGYSLLK